MSIGAGELFDDLLGPVHFEDRSISRGADRLEDVKAEDVAPLPLARTFPGTRGSSDLMRGGGASHGRGW